MKIASKPKNLLLSAVKSNMYINFNYLLLILMKDINIIYC